jgi:SAM-dependent methyltransferase
MEHASITEVLKRPVPRFRIGSEDVMEPLTWIPAQATALLDVGCNTGDLLRECRAAHPRMRLVGVDVNLSAVEQAKAATSDIDFHQARGHELPFEDAQFDCVTCIEVIEHVPAANRHLLLTEINRVLRKGGRLVLRCPHDGLFSCLDAQNFRFHFPRLYNLLLRHGMRDSGYVEAGEEIVWHHHFRKEELLELAGDGWIVEACRYGGLLLFPISDILRYPFYRLKRIHNPVFAALQKIAGYELRWDFGKQSYGILLVLQKRYSKE